ncbi:MAG: KH domain-containing protein [Thermomicrobiales bacterium]
MTDSSLPESAADDVPSNNSDDELDTGNVQGVADAGTAHVNDAEAVEALRELVRYVVDNLVDEPGRAEIVVEQRGNVVALGVRLPEEELGKVIGRGGRIAKSIRTALMVAGSQHHLRVSLDIDASELPPSSELPDEEISAEPES